jgi:hypothetical protein
LKFLADRGRILRCGKCLTSLGYLVLPDTKEKTRDPDDRGFPVSSLPHLDMDFLVAG